ncbi:ribonuclease HI [Leptothermofonsia sp. ETS-13]|uniref:ribonuclease HI n=1 Tax=Leptothermofonsia sp. ETS-13 TaxID=3035696 RepID=UPI003B9F0A36
MSVQSGQSEEALTLQERAERAEKHLSEALEQLEQERQRANAMEAKLRELNVPLDFLASSNLGAIGEGDRPLPQQPKSMIQRIYTDGACSGNPGPGGWGVVVYYADGSVREMGGSDPMTTNNRMEMEAAIAALRFFNETGQTQPVELYTDSEYVLKGMTEWIKGWKRKGWKNSKGKPVENQDLWQVLDLLNSPAVKWCYVRGHSGDEGNDRCDEIARAFSLGRTPILR